MVNIAVLVSGGGTNLQALIDAEKRGEIRNGHITAVISSNPDAYALTRAEQAGIPGITIARKDFGSARDMTVALVYHKCLDDWRDDRSGWARTYAFLLEKAYREVGARHPKACAAIEEGLADIGRLEETAAAAVSSGNTTAAPPPDAAANRFGALLGEVFAWRDDFWAAGLRSLGAKLGKLVYVMDAALDREDDRASGSYNPLVALDAQPQDVREDLELLAADAAAAFEKLPLERDVRVLRSVLYAGVWQKYYAKEAKEAKKAKKAGQPGQAKEPTHVQEEHQEAYRG